MRLRALECTRQCQLSGLLVLRVQDGSMRASAAKAEALIGDALAIDPAHPLAIHLYIHIAEASDPRR